MSNKSVKVIEFGKVTITDGDILIEEFTFEGGSNQKDFAIAALNECIGKLNSEIETLATEAAA